MYYNQAENQEKRNVQQLKIIQIFNQCTYYEKSFFASVMKMTLTHGVAYLSTDSIKKFGGGCRDTQLKSRKKLLQLGLLKEVYTRVKKGTKFNNTNIYVVADWLLDESLAFVIRMFCKIPWYAPIRNVKLWLSKKPTGSQVDSILKGCYEDLSYATLKPSLYATEKDILDAIAKIKSSVAPNISKNKQEAEEKNLQRGRCIPETTHSPLPVDNKSRFGQTVSLGDCIKTMMKRNSQ